MEKAVAMWQAGSAGKNRGRGCSDYWAPGLGPQLGAHFERRPRHLHRVPNGSEAAMQWPRPLGGGVGMDGRGLVLTV